MAPYWIKNSPPKTIRRVINLTGEDIVTTVTNDASSAVKWVDGVLYGDVGWPRVVALRTNCVRGRVCTLRLCARNKCLILQLLHMPYLPPAVYDFLEDGDITFVGFGLDSDISTLEDDYWLWCQNAVDLDRAFTEDMEKLCRQEFDLKDFALEKLRVRLEEDAEKLSEDQVRYASIDAYVCYKLGCKILNDG